MMHKKLDCAFLIVFDSLFIIGLCLSISISIHAVPWLQSHSHDIILLQDNPFVKELLGYFFILLGLWLAVSLYGLVITIWNLREHVLLYKKILVNTSSKESRI